MTKALAVTRALYAQAERISESATRDRGAKTKARWPIDGTVGLQLRRARLAKKLTVDRLSADLGVTVEQYEKFEAGLARIGATRLHKLAAMLQVPPVYFFEDVLGPYSPEKIAGDAEDIQYNRSEKILSNTLEVASEIAQGLSSKPFYDAALAKKIQSIYSGASLFSLFFPPEAVALGPDDKFFASGDALITVPATNRAAKTVEASISVPVRVAGVWWKADPASGSYPPMTVMTSEVAPIEAHQPSDLARRLSAAPRRRSPAAA